VGGERKFLYCEDSTLHRSSTMLYQSKEINIGPGEEYSNKSIKNSRELSPV
jgi:hypothetical protein